MNVIDIINFRKKNKLTQEDLAKILGVTKNTIYNYENGGKIPDSKIPILENILNNKVIEIKNMTNTNFQQGEYLSFYQKNAKPLTESSKNHQTTIKKQQKQIEKMQEQIDNLLEIVKNLTNNQ